MAKAAKKAAESGANSNITDIEHEPITDQQPDQDAQIVELKIIPIDDRKKNEIARYGIADKSIANLKRRFGKLEIKNLEDKDGFKVVKEAWQTVRNLRLAVSKKHTEIKADYLAISKAIDGEKNRLTDLLEPLETELKTKLDKWENEKEAAKLAKENEAKEKLQARVSELIAGGIVFDGSFYSIADISMDVVTLENMPDEKFTELLERVKSENAKLIEAKRIADEQAEADRIALQKQKDDQAAEALRQQKEREELVAEKEKMLQEKRLLRAEKLEGLGMLYNYNQKAWAFENFVVKPAGGDIAELDAAAWNAVFAEADTTIKKFKEDQAIKAAKAKDEKELQEDRYRLLFPFAGFTDIVDLNKLYQFSGAEFEGILSTAKEMKQKDDAKKEAHQKAEQRQALRRQQLTDLFGMAQVPGFFTFRRNSKFDGVPAMVVEGKDIAEPTDAEWEILIASQKTELKNILESERVAQQVINDKAEEERKANMSERELLNDWLDKLQAVAQPDLKTAWNNWVYRINNQISEAREDARDLSEE